MMDCMIGFQAKIIEVGKNSVCLTAGHEGFEEPSLNMRAALRGWVKANANAEIPEAMGGLLEGAEEAGSGRLKNPDGHVCRATGNSKNPSLRFSEQYGRPMSPRLSERKWLFTRGLSEMSPIKPLHQKLLNVGALLIQTG